MTEHAPFWERIYNEPAKAGPWGNNQENGIALTLKNSPNRIQIWIPNKAEAERIAREIIDLALNPHTWR